MARGASLSTSSAKKAAQKRASAPKIGFGTSGGNEMAKVRPGSNFTQTGAVAGPTGAGFTQTGAAASPTNASGTEKPATPDAAPTNTAIQPFLTDAQKAGLSAWNTRYGDEIAQLGENDKLAQDTYTQSLATDTLRNAQNTDMTNQAMAARGMFTSSIRDNALNDLNVTLAQQKLALGTARDATLFTDQNQRNTLGAENTAQQAIYNTDAVTNAQGVTPTVPPVGQAGSQTGAAHPPAPPAAPKPPTPTGPPKPQGVTRTRAPGAALTGLKPAKPPGPPGAAMRF